MESPRKKPPDFPAEVARTGRRLWREVRRGRRALSSGAEIRRYLKGHSVPKLQLGTGHNRLPGWLNTDRDPDSGTVHLNAAKPFPIPTGAFDYVFAEHLIEHFTYESGLSMLRECYRVLRPGGRIRLCTPDLERIVGLQYAPPGGIEERYVRWLVDGYAPAADGYRPSYAINQVFRGWGHRFLYDQKTLAAALERIGFSGVTGHGFGHSDDAELAGIEGHGVADGNSGLSAFETLTLEAHRP